MSVKKVESERRRYCQCHMTHTSHPPAPRRAATAGRSVSESLRARTAAGEYGARIAASELESL
jgi:hypothetical protein